MVSLKKVEDRPTPPEVYSWKIYGLAAIAGESNGTSWKTAEAALTWTLVSVAPL